MNGMSVLIQHRQTKLFYNCDGLWVRLSDAASDFPSPLTALKYAAGHQLGDTEVIFIPHTPIPSRNGGGVEIRARQ